MMLNTSDNTLCLHVGLNDNSQTPSVNAESFQISGSTCLIVPNGI